MTSLEQLFAQIGQAAEQWTELGDGDYGDSLDEEFWQRWETAREWIVSTGNRAAQLLKAERAEARK